MVVRQGSQSRDEFDKALDKEIKELLRRNFPGKVGFKDLADSRIKNAALSIGAAKIAADSMDLTSEQRRGLRDYESQMIRAVNIGASYRMMCSHGSTDVGVTKEVFTRFLQVLREDLDEYGSQMSADPKARLSNTISGKLGQLTELEPEDVLADPATYKLVQTAMGFNQSRMEKLLGNKAGEYYERLGKAIQGMQEELMKHEPKIQADEDRRKGDVHIFKAEKQPDAAGVEAVDFNQLLSEHSTDIAFPEYSQEFAYLEPFEGSVAYRRMMTAQGQWTVRIRREVEEELRGQLEWARVALKPHQKGDNAVEARSASRRLKDGVLSNHFALYPDGTVEKRETVVKRPSPGSPIAAGNVLVSTHFALMDEGGKIMYGVKSIDMPRKEFKQEGG